MISNSSRSSVARLVQDAVWDPDLADVVQRRRLVQQLDVLVGQRIG
jgi:hypothetical protein